MQLHETPDEATLATLLELVADLNAQWFLEEWASGRWPPSSCRAAGVLYRPDALALAVTLATAPIVFAEKVASCGPIAAVSVGQARAAEAANGLPYAETRQRHRIHLAPQRDRYWHAMHRTPTGLFDATEGMRRWGSGS